MSSSIAAALAAKAEENKVVDLDQAEDRELVRIAQSGDTRAFDVLVKRYQTRIYALAYQQTKNREDALDITQEAFIRAYKALPRWKPTAKWYTWVYAITRNLCIDHHRAQTRRRTESLDDPDSGVPEPICSRPSNDPLAQAIDRERSELIQNAMSSLSSRQREIVQLHHFGGLKVREAAEKMGVKEGTAKAHLFRALAKLRKVLQPMRDRNEI